MIDLGLGKMAIVGIVALLVVGPERLPKVARMAGSLLGRAQRYLNQVKSEVNREIELEELRKMQQDVKSSVSEFEQTISQAQEDITGSFHSLSGDVEATAWSPDPSTEQRSLSRFKRNRLNKSGAVPGWYKSRHGVKQRLLSGSGRMARYRVQRQNSRSFF